MIKGTAEKINMILFGRKKFISKISTPHPSCRFPALLSIPALTDLCCFQEGDKVFGLRMLQDAAWHTSSHSWESLSDRGEARRPARGLGSARARAAGTLDGAFVV